jgi:hypothetical protein
MLGLFKLGLLPDDFPGEGESSIYFKGFKVGDSLSILIGFKGDMLDPLPEFNFAGEKPGEMGSLLMSSCST